jgi:hypothetical protein
MTHTARAWSGFLVAPVVPAGFLYLFGLLKGYGDVAIVGPLLLAPFAYAAALVIGVPVYLLLQRKGVHGVGAYLALGAAIGATVVVLMFGTEALFSWTSAREHALGLIRNSGGYMVVAIVYAAIAAAVFWLIAVRGQSAR